MSSIENGSAEPRHVVVAGAGLVGSLLSVYLARRGCSVDVYERRPDMRREVVSAGRSINLAVSVRGIHALKQVGLAEEVLAEAVPMRGRMMHAVDGTLAYQPYGKDESECIHSISRGRINRVLLTAAEETGKVRLHFRHRATSAELDAGALTFEDEVTGVSSRVTGDVVFGTDGSGSALRAAFDARPGFEGTRDVLDAGYKEFHIPPGPDGAHRLEKHALHIWPRGQFMLIALPNFDGSFTCTLFLPWEGPQSFAALEASGDVAGFFRQWFPDVLPLLVDPVETWSQNPTGQMVTVKCAPWAAGKSMLLGDASHAIVPFFGQGMNSGFEDVSLLDALMGHAPDSWPTHLEAYARHRKPDTDAIADMARANFVEMRDKVGDRTFLLQKATEKELLNRFPDKFLSRYAMVSFSRVPYRTAEGLGRIADGILEELCAGLTTTEQVDWAKAERLVDERLASTVKELARG